MLELRSWIARPLRPRPLRHVLLVTVVAALTLVAVHEAKEDVLAGGLAACATVAAAGAVTAARKPRAASPRPRRLSLPWRVETAPAAFLPAIPARPVCAYPLRL